MYKTSSSPILAPKMRTIFTLFCIAAAVCNGYIVNPGPVVKATIGAVWPKPKEQTSTNEFYLINPNNFKIEAIDHTCDILDKAIERYTKIIQDSANSPIHWNTKRLSVRFVPNLERIQVNLTQPCEVKPYLNMNERYFVNSIGLIEASSIWGILRGLETFSQLVTPFKDGLLHVRATRITDEPRFEHRGLLLDTSRHFMSMETIYKVIDGMAYNKLNVFHWHIVDDHSFPYESRVFPELSEKGAYAPEMVYSQQDVANVIEYARIRGIRVLPEFDVPGHTRSWGNSHPEILAKCEGSYQGMLGPINPIENASYDFLKLLFREIVEVFPEQYVHLGGDEVGFECWESNEEIRNYVESRNITYEYLQRQFMEKVTRMVADLRHTPLVWQEAMVEDVHIPLGSIVQVWTGNWRDLLRKFTQQGHRVLMSECWYLDHLATGGDWLKFYNCEPHNFVGTNEQKKLVIGGEACMWSEVVSDRNVLPRIFPRVSAAAERLWSPEEVKDVGDAKQRLEEHTCRMVTRGIPAQPPNGPGIC